MAWGYISIYALKMPQVGIYENQWERIRFLKHIIYKLDQNK